MATGFPTKVNYATGDVLTAANMNDLAGTVNYLQYMPPRNPVLNSAMNIWQRGTSFSYSASTAYSADRWQGRTGTGAQTISRQTTSDTTNLPNIQYCARVGRNNGNTGTGIILFEQSFETINTIPFVGKQVTFSFYARAGANFSGTTFYAAVVTGTGTDQNISGYTGGANTILGTATLTTTWQRFTYTGTIPTTTNEMGIQFSYTPVGTAGAADYFEVTGVQIELGSVANTYMPNQPTYQGELAACQRYYWRAGGDSVYQYFGQGSFYSSTGAYIALNSPVPMRVAPSSLEYSTLQTYDYSGTQTINNITMAVQSKLMTVLDVTLASGGTQFRPNYIRANNSTSAYIALNAEL